MINEVTFYRSKVKGYLSEWGDHDRIENAIGSGIPDISYCIAGRQGWLELKIVHANGKIYFQQFQPAWLKRRARHSRGTGVFVLAAGINGDKTWLWLYPPQAIFDAELAKEDRWLTVRRDRLKPMVAGQDVLQTWLEIKTALSQ